MIASPLLAQFLPPMPIAFLPAAKGSAAGRFGFKISLLQQPLSISPARRHPSRNPPAFAHARPARENHPAGQDATAARPHHVVAGIPPPRCPRRPARRFPLL